MREVDLTKGKLSSALIKFSAPIVLMNLFHALYGLADLFILGHFTQGSIGVSAVAIGFSAIFIFMLFIFGISTGATVMIGKAFGAKELEELDKIVGTMMTVFSALGIACGFALYFASPLIVKLMQSPLEVVEPATVYIRICAGSMLFISLINMISAVLRGLGNSITPLLYVGLSVSLNIVLDFVFVYFFGWGVVGVAVATVIAQLVGLVFALWYLRKHEFLFMFRLQDFCFCKDKAKEVFVLGIPISLQDVLINLSFLLIFALANKMGLASSAAYGIGQRLYGFTMLPAFSLGIALAAITAQHIGARYIKRAKKALLLSIAYAYIFCGFFFFVQILFPEWVMALFTNDAATIAAGKEYLLSSSWELWVIAPTLCMLNFFNGCGRTTFTMIISISTTFLVRVPAAVILTYPEGSTLYDLGWSAVIACTIETILFLIALKSEFWRKKSLRRPAAATRLPAPRS